MRDSTQQKIRRWPAPECQQLIRRVYGRVRHVDANVGEDVVGLVRWCTVAEEEGRGADVARRQRIAREKVRSEGQNCGQLFPSACIVSYVLRGDL